MLGLNGARKYYFFVLRPLPVPPKKKMCSKVSILNPQVFFLASRFMIPHEATLALRRGTRNVLLLRERESRWGGGVIWRESLRRGQCSSRKTCHHPRGKGECGILSPPPLPQPFINCALRNCCGGGGDEKWGRDIFFAHLRTARKEEGGMTIYADPDALDNSSPFFRRGKMSSGLVFPKD